jgi:hypothetical protein
MRAHPKDGEEFCEETRGKGVLFTRSNIPEISPALKGFSGRVKILSWENPLRDNVILPCFLSGSHSPVDSKDIALLLTIILDKNKFFLRGRFSFLHLI